MRLLLVALGFVLLCAANPATAEPTQLTGSHALIELPEGFVQSPQFTGAIWEDGKASILVTELPAEAYKAVADGLLADPTALQDQDILLDKTRVITLGEHQAVLGTGRQLVDAQPFDKWLLLVGAPHVTLLVTAQAPTIMMKPERIAKIEAALHSIRVAPDRGDVRAALPFVFGETRRFRFLRALSGNAALLTDTAYSGEAGHRPLFVVTTALSQDCDAWADGVHAFAEKAAQSIGQIKDLAIADTHDARLGMDRGVVTEGEGMMNGRKVVVVQTFRFRDCAYLRTIGIGPANEEAVYRAEFAMLAARVCWRPAAEAEAKPQ